MIKRQDKKRAAAGLKNRGLKHEVGVAGKSANVRLTAVLTAIVCAAVCVTHWPVLSARALTFDDEQYFTENVLVQKPGIESAKRFLGEVLKPSTVAGYYQPLTMISLMIDYRLGGREGDLLLVHRTSLILHIMNTALLIIFVYHLFGVPWAAAAGGLLFGLHPMTVEPVAWISERKTLLATFFSLWSLIFYVRFARSGDLKVYFGCMTAYILALMSKPTSVPLPILMLLLDFWPLRRLNKRAVWEKSHPAMKLVKMEELNQLIAKVHSGALKYYNEIGFKVSDELK